MTKSKLLVKRLIPSIIAATLSLLVSSVTTAADKKPEDQATIRHCGLLLTSPSHIPLHGLKNPLINYATGMSKYGKVQLWSLGHILSVTTERSFAKRARGGEYVELIGFMIGDELDVHYMDEKGNKAYDGSKVRALMDKSKEAASRILLQYPELATVNPPNFDSEDQVWLWMSEQERKFGLNLPLVPLPNPYEKLN